MNNSVLLLSTTDWLEKETKPFTLAKVEKSGSVKIKILH